MITIAGYEAHRLLREGPISTLAATRSKDDLPVLLKLTTKEHPARDNLAVLQREFEITRTLDLQEIIHPIELSPHRDGLLLVQADHGGVPLREMLAGNPMDVDDFLALAVRLAQSLGRIHQSQLIHRNLSSNGIFVEPGFVNPRFTDFGLASRFAIDESAKDLTSDVLNLQYISPEQTGRMDRSVDRRSDLYSLGVTFYEMLVGQPPFIAQDPAALVHAHLAKPAVSPSELVREIPEPISEVVLKLLAKTPEERYQSGLGLEQDLAWLVEQRRHGQPLSGFRAGAKDISDVFRVPHTLFGRDEQSQILLDGLGRATRGSCELILVTGSSGIGKSALVRGLQASVAGTSRVLSGKFDRLRQNLPYTAFIQVFQERLRELLSAPESVTERLRLKFLDVLGINAQIIIDFIPEFERIIGPQPAPPELGQPESQNRFRMVMREFISVFAQEDRPFVMFLDDLQWADSASLEVIQSLVTDSSLRNLLLIGAYRDGELDGTHPLTALIENLTKRDAPMTSLKLTPFTADDVNALTAASLVTNPDACRELGQLIFDKTVGNPFFVKELLQELHREGLIYFSSQVGRKEDDAQPGWQWRLEEIRNARITDNVVSLLVEKLQKLSEKSREVLTLAAHIGNRFSLRDLEMISGLSPFAIAAALNEPISNGLITSIDDFHPVLMVDPQATPEEPCVGEQFADAGKAAYKFIHDRVQEAAYSVVAEPERRQIHLRIGRLFLRTAEQRPQQVQFDIVNHLNIGLELIDDPAEREQLADLNLDAGRKAKAATAYAEAVSYLRAGMLCLDEDCWETHYTVTFSISLELAECEYLATNFDEAERLCTLMIGRAESTLDLVAVHGIRVKLLMNLTQFEAAVDSAISALGVLGIHISKQPTRLSMVRHLVRITWHRRRRSIEDLEHLPNEMNDEQRAAMSLLPDVFACAFLMGHEDLQSSIAFWMVELSLKHGNSEVSAMGYACYGVCMSSILGRRRTGYELCRMSMRLARSIDDPVWMSRVLFVYSSYFSHHGAPLKQSVDYLEEAFRLAVQSGDPGQAGYCSDVLNITMPFAGFTLEEVQTTAGKYLSFAQRNENTGSILTIFAVTNFISRLTTGEPEPDVDIDARLAAMSPVERSWFDFLEMIFRYSNGEYQEAVDLVDELRGTTIVDPSIYFVAVYYFIHSLALTALYPSASVAQRYRIRRTINANQRRLARLGSNYPDNYLPMQRLVAAELDRLHGRQVAARRHYDEAISLAKKSGLAYIEALANELSGRFHLALGSPVAARAYFSEAEYRYASWGAHYLANRVRDVQAGDLAFGMRSAATPPELASLAGLGSIDVTTVIKASQNIAGEIVLETLLGKLMMILIENTGAQRGVLLLKHDDEFVIEAESGVDLEAEANTDTSDAPEADPQDVEVSSRLPMAIVNLVTRGGEPVMINDAIQDDRFASDPYVAEFQPKSILCSPLISQTKLIGAVYLENRLATNAFTPDRLSMVSMLSGPAAIAIENARLYENQVALTKSATRFVPTEFLRLLDRKDIMEVELGDQVQMDLSFMITDIHSFTALSERMTPRENFEFINNYFQHVVPVIRRQQGIVGKYTGDGLMALFSGPPDDSVATAVEIMRNLSEFNAARMKSGLSRIQTGIGIHFGNAILGTVGEAERMQGDVMSDAVNLAARLEGLTRRYGALLLVSGDAFSRLHDPARYQHRFLGKFQVKGRTGAIDIYEICDEDYDPTAALKLGTNSEFGKGLALYFGRKFAEASVLFNLVLERNPSDEAAKLYLGRCARLMVDHPGPDWEGVELVEDK